MTTYINLSDLSENKSVAPLDGGPKILVFNTSRAAAQHINDHHLCYKDIDPALEACPPTARIVKSKKTGQHAIFMRYYPVDAINKSDGPPKSGWLRVSEDQNHYYNNKPWFASYDPREDQLYRQIHQQNQFDLPS